MNGWDVGTGLGVGTGLPDEPEGNHIVSPGVPTDQHTELGQQISIQSKKLPSPKTPEPHHLKLVRGININTCGNTWIYIYIHKCIYTYTGLFINVEICAYTWWDARYVAVVSPPGVSKHNFVLAHYSELHYESTTPLPDSSTWGSEPFQFNSIPTHRNYRHYKTYQTLPRHIKINL